MTHGVKHNNEFAKRIAEEADMNVRYLKRCAIRLAEKLQIKLPRHNEPCGD